jgi:hypothetical protein
VLIGCSLRVSFSLFVGSRPAFSEDAFHEGVSKPLKVAPIAGATFAEIVYPFVAGNQKRQLVSRMRKRGIYLRLRVGLTRVTY